MPSGYSTTILCLANSRKPGGRCVAGRSINGSKFDGSWVRPVSTRSGRELYPVDRQYDGGAEPSLLDVISIDFLGRSQHPYQPENHTIDDKVYWSHVKKASFGDACSALDPIRVSLWENGNSSYSGINDRVLEANCPSYGYSLTLIEVNDLTVHVSAEGASFGNMKRKLRGCFSYNQGDYGLTITDPVIESQFLAGADGSFDVGRALLCISLGEPYQGYAYKLVAGVIAP